MSLGHPAGRDASVPGIQGSGLAIQPLGLTLKAEREQLCGQGLNPELSGGRGLDTVEITELPIGAGTSDKRASHMVRSTVADDACGRCMRFPSSC